MGQQLTASHLVSYHEYTFFFNYLLLKVTMTEKNYLIQMLTKKIKVSGSFRILIPLYATYILFAFSFFFIFIPQQEAQLLNQKKEVIRQLIDNAISLLSEINSRVEQGDIPLEKARAQAVSQIRTLRYGPDGQDYFWIIDTHPSMIMHPHRPDLEGKDLALIQDAKGNYPFVDMAQKAMAGQGSYVNKKCLWEDASHRVASKTSYVKRFPAWNWIVGTGIHTDDIHEALSAIHQKFIQIFAGILTFIILLSIYITKQVFRIERQNRQAETEKKLDELRLKKLLELSQIAEKSINTLMEFALEEACKLTGSQFGCLAFLNEDQADLTIHNWPKHPVKDGETGSKKVTCQMKESGLWAEAEKSRDLLVINDFKNYSPLSEQGFPRDDVTILRVMSAPVFAGGKMVALISVGNKNQDYNESDIRQLQLMMDGMWKILQGKKNDIELQKSEERYRLLADNATDTIWVLQLPDLGLRYASPSMEYLLGYTPSELSMLKREDYMTKNSLKQLPRLISEQLSQDASDTPEPKRLKTVELELIKKDGTCIWVEITASVLKNDKGEPDRILGISRDISERKRASDALQRTTELLREAGRIARVGGWSADIKSQTILWSDEMNAIHERPAHTPPSIDEIKSFVAPEWQDKIENGYNRCMEEGKSLDEEFEIITANGNHRWVHVTGEAVRDGAGNIIRVIGALQDISDRIQADEERKKLQEHLAQARKMEAIGVLAGGIAHDFNNILSGLMGFTDLAMIEAGNNETLKGYLAQVSSSSLRARDLVRHILTFSRKTDVKKQPLIINPIIKELLKFMRASLPASIEIKYDLKVDQEQVFGDATQIYQILMGLFTNAGYAMKDKGGTLEVTMDSVTRDDIQTGYAGETPGKNFIELVISDTGCGIHEKHLDRIFEPFFTTKGREEGTGMGLATVYGIIKEMGGTISVSSEVGAGSTFTILLPRHDKAQALDKNVNGLLKKGRGNILMVDDEITIAESTCELLTILGYTVTTETDSMKAIDIVKNNPAGYDLVLTDMTMPRMDGFELAQQIKQINPHIPVVLSTGFSDGLTKEKCESAGIADMVMKPLTVSELSVAIEKVINKNNTKE